MLTMNIHLLSPTSSFGEHGTTAVLIDISTAMDHFNIGYLELTVTIFPIQRMGRITKFS